MNYLTLILLLLTGCATGPMAGINTPNTGPMVPTVGAGIVIYRF